MTHPVEEQHGELMDVDDTRPLKKTPETGRDTPTKPYFGVNSQTGGLVWMNEEPS